MLTQKQEDFAKCIVEGMSQIDAYKNVYKADNMSDNAISVEATRLIQNPKVSLRIKELREHLAKSTIMTAQERLEFLTRVIKGEEKEIVHRIYDGEEYSYEEGAELNTKLKAVDLMNKMQGEYVQKIDANVNADVNISIELTEE